MNVRSAAGGIKSAANNNTSSSMTSGTSVSNGEQAKMGELFSQSKDAQTMISALKDMGIEDFEPRVVNQLLEFSYRELNLKLIFKMN